MSDKEVLRAEIREAARRAFAAVRAAHPDEHFYYFALVTTEDALRPGPSASSLEGLRRACESQDAGPCAPDVLRWSEADSPYNLFGDEHFKRVAELFLEGGDHRHLPDPQYEAEVATRFAAMEQALRDLDDEGFFGVGDDRAGVVINVVAPGDEGEEQILRRAEQLNPPASLSQIRVDLGAG
jgi:hypothetical protein